MNRRVSLVTTTAVESLCRSLFWTEAWYMYTYMYQVDRYMYTYMYQVDRPHHSS